MGRFIILLALFIFPLFQTLAVKEEDDPDSAERPTIFLHLGAHKTGSTLIQQALEQNRAPLSAMGIEYLSVINIEGSPNLAQSIAEKLARNKTLIMSNELFLGRTCFEEGNSEFYPAQETTLRGLKKILDPFNATIVPILYIRSISSCLESHFMQIYNDVEVSDFSTFREKTKTLQASWSKVIDVSARVFQKQPLVRCFEELAEEGPQRFVSRFFSIVTSTLGIEGSLTVKPMTGRETNRSLSEAGMQVAKEMSTHPLDYNSRWNLICALKDYLNNQSYGEAPIRQMLDRMRPLLGPDLLQKLQASVRQALIQYPAPTRPTLYTRMEKALLMKQYKEEHALILEAFQLKKYLRHYYDSSLVFSMIPADSVENTESPLVLRKPAENFDDPDVGERALLRVRRPVPNVRSKTSLIDRDWSMIETPLDLSEISPVLRHRVMDYLKFKSVREKTGTDFDALRGELGRTPFHYQDYKDMAATIRKPLTLPKGASIICVTHRPWDLDNILKNFRWQTYGDIELLIILNGKAYNRLTVEAKIARESAELQQKIKLFDTERRRTLGECLNFGAFAATKDIVTKWDGDDIYGPNYVSDVVDPFFWSTSDISGKIMPPVYWEHSNKVTFFRYGDDDPFTRSYPFYAHRTGKGLRVTGSSITLRRDILRGMPFRSQNKGEDDSLFLDAIARGLSFSSSDYANHLVLRNTDEEQHTWKPLEAGHFQMDRLTVIYDSRRVNGIFL